VDAVQIGINRMGSHHGRQKLGNWAINERIFSVCLSKEWDDACRRRDREAMIALLCVVELSEAPDIVDKILVNPEIYLGHLGEVVK
jgi:hypothetical protein